MLDYQRDDFAARLEGQWAANQDHIADYELPTDGYFLVNAGLSYDLQVGDVATTFYVKAVNLLDQEARQSTSFLKDIAPLPGRGLMARRRSGTRHEGTMFLLGVGVKTGFFAQCGYGFSSQEESRNSCIIGYTPQPAAGAMG